LRSRNKELARFSRSLFCLARSILELARAPSRSLVTSARSLALAHARPLARAIAIARALISRSEIALSFLARYRSLEQFSPRALARARTIAPARARAVFSLSFRFLKLKNSSFLKFKERILSLV